VRPFTSTSKVNLVGMHLSEPVPKIRERAPGLDVPEGVENLVARLLKKSASERPAHASEVVKTIDALLAKRLFPPYERSFGARMIRMVSERWADARAFFRPLLARLVPQARAAFERLVAWLDAPRAMLPKPAAERLAKVPSRAIAGIILGFAGLVVLLALVGIVGAIVGSASPQPPAEFKTASSSEASAPVPSAGPSMCPSTTPFCHSLNRAGSVVQANTSSAGRPISAVVTPSSHSWTRLAMRSGVQVGSMTRTGSLATSAGSSIQDPSIS